MLYFLYFLWNKMWKSHYKIIEQNYPWVNMKFISWKFCTIKNSGGKIQKIVKVGGARAMILFGLLVKLLCCQGVTRN